MRAHVEGCRFALSIPVDLCKCGGRDFMPDLSADEVLAVAVLVENELLRPHHTHPSDRSARPKLETALAKLRPMAQMPDLA